MVMVSVVSVKITRKSPTRKRFASTPTSAFTLLACDDASSAYCLILIRINLLSDLDPNQFGSVCVPAQGRRRGSRVENRFHSPNYLIRRYNSQSQNEIF